MFSPTKLLNPFSYFGSHNDETGERADPYANKTELQLFQSKHNIRFVATLLHENFTTLKYFDIYETDTSARPITVIILSKSHSNQLYRMSGDLKTIVKWVSIDNEITLLDKVNNNLVIQDEYA